MHPNVRAVVAAAAERGLAIEPRHFDESTRTAQEAADAIGVALGQIVKSLVFAVDGQVVVALMSGSNRLDEHKLAHAAGGHRAKRVDAEAARAATGFPIGGVPPFGHATSPPVFIDQDLMDWPELWAAAGTPHVNFAITPEDLRACGGTVCDLAAG